MTILLNIAAAILGTGALVVFGVFIYRSRTGEDPFLFAMHSQHYKMSLPSNILVYGTMVTTIVLTYKGAIFLLSWMPDSINYKGHDGELTTTQFIAAFYSISIGALLSEIISNASKNMFLLRESSILADENQRIFDSIAAPYKLQSLKAEYIKKASLYGDLANATRMNHSISSGHQIVNERLERVYKELIFNTEAMIELTKQVNVQDGNNQY